MSRAERIHLLGEKSTLERLLEETTADEVLDRASLMARLRVVEEALTQTKPDEREPARARLTFRGRPVIGSHGIFAEFGMKAVTGFTDVVAAMAASLSAPLAASGPIPNRDQHQLLITSTALGSFGFELEEHRAGQLAFDDERAVATAIERTQSILRGTQGTDDELADSVAEADRRVLDKVRAFLQTLADHEAVCAVQFGASVVAWNDVGHVRTSLGRLSQENLHEHEEVLHGELRGVLPDGRLFEFLRSDSSQIIRGKVATTIDHPERLNRHHLRQNLHIKVMVTRVGNGRPRYVLLEAPVLAPTISG